MGQGHPAREGGLETKTGYREKLQREERRAGILSSFISIFCLKRVMKDHR